MKWKHSLLAIFGISILIVTFVTMFSFNLPGPIYFAVMTPIYVVFTLYLAKKNKDKSAKKIIGIFGVSGFLISIIFSVLAFLVSSAFFFQMEDVMLYLFPSSFFWMALDTPGKPEMGSIMGVYTAAIVVNTLLYSLYGCVFYYLKKLFSENERPA